MATKENVNPMELIQKACRALDESAKRNYNAWYKEVEETSQWMQEYFEDVFKRLNSGNNSQVLVPKTPSKKMQSIVSSTDNNCSVIMVPVARKSKVNDTLKITNFVEEKKIYPTKLSGVKCDESILRLSPDPEECISRSRLSSEVTDNEKDTLPRKSSLAKLEISPDNTEETIVRRSKRVSKAYVKQVEDSTKSSSRLSFKKPAKPCPVRTTRSTRLSRKKGATQAADKSLNLLDSISSGNESETARVPVEEPLENKKRESSRIRKVSQLPSNENTAASEKSFPITETAKVVKEVAKEVASTTPPCKVSLERMDDEIYRRVSQQELKFKNDEVTQPLAIVHPTPVVGRTSPLTPRNAKRLSLTLRLHSPKSPRQLFSPYAKQSVMSKANAFENLKTPVNSQIRKINPQTIIIKPAIGSPLIEVDENSLPNRRRSTRSSASRKTLSKDLILAKVDRMSISKRRSSRVRLSMLAVKNQIYNEIIEKRKSISIQDQTEEKELPGASSIDGEPPVNGDNSDSEYESATDDEGEMRNKRSKNSSSGEKKIKRTHSFLKRSIPKGHCPQSLPKNLTTSRVAFFNSLGTKQGGSAGKLCASTSRVGLNNKSAASPAIVSKMKESWFKEEMEKKKQREKAAYAKKEQLLKERMVLSKKKNEEKQMKVLEKRQQLFKAKEERKRTIELKQEQHAARKQALEEKRKEELEKKKKEELATKQRILALKEAQLEEQRKIEAALAVEEQTQAQSVSSTLKSKFVSSTSLDILPSGSLTEKPIPKTLAITKQALNETFNADSSEVSQYDITPHHSEMTPQKLVDPNNYDIDDLKSDDDTDDESAPRKQIPSWAQGTKLHMLIRKQTMMIKKKVIDIEELFPLQDIMKEFNLAGVFSVHRRRFFNRTSSAVWHVQPSGFD